MNPQVDKFEELAGMYRLFGNPTRLAILTLLSKRPMTGEDIKKKLDLCQANVSHQLSLLAQGNMVVRKRAGMRVLFLIADLAHHHLGRKSKTTLPNTNAARFGPLELAYPEKPQEHCGGGVLTELSSPICLLESEMITLPIGEFKELDGLFFAMSNVVRLAILQLLAKKEMTVSAIQEKLKFSQPVILEHLKRLYHFGLVERRSDDKRAVYYIADLSEHRLGQKSKATKPGSNAARFGPVELVLLQTVWQSDNLEEIAEFFKLFNHRDRLRIVALLAKGELNVMAIRSNLKLVESVIRAHLTLLHRSGLVRRRRGFKRVYFYKLADLSKHRLGKTSELAKAGSNAARFGPVELVFPQK
jgi:ArsR family transcriptional regulator, lead/cadmium/zinc/bismuth-responsive transcriptional repressor